MVLLVPGAARLRLRLVRLPQPRHRRLPLDHHPGADLRADARLLPQRDGLRRQQRPDRLPRRARLLARRPTPRAPALFVLSGLALAVGDPARPRDHHLEVRQGAGRRCATPRAGRASSATGSSTTSSSSSPSRRCSPGSPARSTCRRSASSTRASSRPANSIEIVIWVALGGRGTLIGAALGALIVAAAKSWLTANFPEAWLFVLGAAFILVTIFLPKGVLGLFDSLGAGAQASREPGAAARAGGVARMAARPSSTSRTCTAASTATRRSTACRSPSPRASCAPSSARTAPARPRCSTSSPARPGPTSGRVVWDEDTDLTRLDEADCARLGIGRKFQKPTVFETLSVEDNLMLALAGERGVAGDAAPPAHRRRGAADRRAPRARRPRPTRASGSPAASATARSSGSRSACCWRRTRSCCSSTSRRPA